ncbi:MAG: hypothetical protein GY737_13300 [Desulfobacteraceae bacterium]|nr:hypothetical protein [Desulfobacteraceae bacterium]
MDQISRKVNQWIDSGKDPRSAHWQGGLEEMLNLFTPHVEPGKLTPVGPLAEADIPVFKAALEAVDLSPDLIAAFLPPTVAGAVIPPDSAEELLRIDEKEPSYKIMIARPGKELRIVCAEISDRAAKPGADIFEGGALLGTYDFPSQEVCLSELTKLIRAHAWKKDNWSREDHERYTLNWFERSMDLSRGDLGVEESRSFFHSPTLIKSNRVDALFLLIHELLIRRFSEPKDPLGNAAASIRAITDKTLRSRRAEDLASQAVLQFLNHIRQLELMKFDELSNAENERCKVETTRTIRKVTDTLAR